MTCSPSRLLKGWGGGFGIICSKSASVSAIWRLCLSIIHQCVKRRAREQLSIEGQPIALIQVKSDVWLPEQAYHSQAARWLWPGDTTSTLDLDFFTLRGFSPQCKYLGLACFPCVDGRPPRPRSLFQQNNKETWRGNRAPFRSLLCDGCQFFISAGERQTNWPGNNHDFEEKRRRGGNEPELRKWPLSKSPALGPHGTARMPRRVFVHFLLREWYTIRKGQYE